MNKNHLLLGLIGCLLTACPTPITLTDAGDAPAVDTGPGTDTPRDTGMRADAPSGPVLPALRAAFEDYTDAFCTCLPMRNPMVTMAACLTANEPDVDVQACEDRGYAMIGDAFDGYNRCRITAVEALTACNMTNCTTAGIMGCDADFQTANMACQGMIPMAAATTFVTEYNACIVERVTGMMDSCPDDATAMSSGLGMSVFSGDTMLAGNDSEPLMGCFPDAMSMMQALGSPDRSYRWIAPSAGRFRLDTIGSSFDTILSVRASCIDTVDVACSDDIELGVDQDSCLIIDATAGQEFVVIVDGFGELIRGTFQVNIATATAGEMCPTMAVTPPG